MVSPTARSDIRAAIAAGIPLTPEDIIRLNALGLKHDYAKSGADMRVCPRLSWLGDVAFREPTIGHEYWMHQAAELFDLANAETLIKVRAFCLATAPEDLPDLGKGRKAIEDKVVSFCKERIPFYTLGQVAAALTFAETGNEHTANEIPVPPPEKDGKRKRKAPPRDVERCYEVGLLRNGVLLKLGSPEDLKKLTVSGLELLIVEELKSNPRYGAEYRKDLVSAAFADYKRTLSAILAERKAQKMEAGDGETRA